MHENYYFEHCNIFIIYILPDFFTISFQCVLASVSSNISIILQKCISVTYEMHFDYDFVMKVKVKLFKGVLHPWALFLKTLCVFSKK